MTAALALLCSLSLAELTPPKNPLWKTARDDVYLQEVGRQIRTQKPLSSVAVLDGMAFVGSVDGVQRVERGRLVEVGGPREPVRWLETLGGALWAATEKGLWRYRQGAWSSVAAGEYTSLCQHRADVVVSTRDHIYRLDGDKPVQLNGRRSDRPILGVASYGETIYVRHAGSVGFLHDGDFQYEDVADWGHLQHGCQTRDMLSLGSRLLVATDQGLGVLRGTAWTHIQGKHGLCYEDTTCLAPGFARDVWIGTSRGVIRATGDEHHFFGHQRWIPDDKVNGVACGDNVVFVATQGGLGIIEFQPYTLLKKAAWYERWLEEWGQKRLGFTHKLFRGEEPGNWLREVSDNDGGFTSHYLDALCFKYAVTRDETVREAAVDAFKALKWCEEITSITGFPARSIWAVGERGIKAAHGSGGLPAEWHRTPDGLWEWKADTSSDEIDAHFHAVSIFLELVARGEEKDWAREHIRRVTTHIIDSGWYLRDVDGEPTRWGRWAPEYLQRPYGYYARGLNGMEALNYTTTAYALLGDAKFLRGKQQLLDWGYHREALRQKLVFPPHDITHFDDRLAFYTYFSLLRYERDPELRSNFMRSLERSWEIKRIEGSPWFNFIYGALTGNDCEVSRALRHLREWPLDCVDYSYTNSHRDDLHVPRGYASYSEGSRPTSPRECGPQRWDFNFLRLDGGSGGRAVTDPAGWLDAYWMGRYFGFIEAPTVGDPALIDVERRGLQLGADSYDGPPRPQIPRRTSK